MFTNFVLQKYVFLSPIILTPLLFAYEIPSVLLLHVQVDPFRMSAPSFQSVPQLCASSILSLSTKEDVHTFETHHYGHILIKHLYE